MSGYVKRWLVAPVAIPIGVSIVVGILIVGIGELLIHLHDPEGNKDTLNRPELLTALGLAAVALFGLAYVSTRPHNPKGLLERQRVVGGPFLAPPPPPLDMQMRVGIEGSLNDIAEGYTLYARNGRLARVIGTVPGSEEYGRRFSGYIYAMGLHGASDELWVPYEAVIGVYPETRAVFLSIKGDETEHFGWNKPPLSVSRRAPREEGPKGL